MSKTELREVLKQTTTLERDIIDAVIFGHASKMTERFHETRETLAAAYRGMLDLGLIVNDYRNGARYAGGPISQFYAVWLEDYNFC